MLKTVIFFLSETEGIRRVDQQEYVRLIRGEEEAPRYAGQTVRVADWYIKSGEGSAPEIENETYSLLSFDVSGLVISPGRNMEEEGGGYCSGQGGGGKATRKREDLRGSNVESPWLPTEEERARMGEKLS